MGKLEELINATSATSAETAARTDEGRDPTAEYVEPEDPETAEFLELVEAGEAAVRTLAEVYRRLAALPQKPRTFEGLSSAHPVRLGATAIRARTKEFTHNERAFAHPRQGWDPEV